jgi:hypothetical protein
VRKCLLRALVACNVVLYGIAWSGPLSAAEDEGAEKDRVAVFEVAATVEREISERTSHVGPAVGVEIEPIEGWLEIELGASTYRSHGATNWELELPFKKPFRLSDTIEIMPGIGPTWTHTTQTGQRPSVWGGEAVVDLFFWRSKRFGWYLEPSYGATFASGHAKSLAVTAGLFFAVP